MIKLILKFESSGESIIEYIDFVKAWKILEIIAPKINITYQEFIEKWCR